MDAAAEAEDLTVATRAGALRVERLAFRVETGGALVLEGPVEAGSAVLRALVGIEPPESGACRLLGASAAALPRAAATALLARVGWMPRTGAFVANLTLRENLLLPWRFHRSPLDGEAAARAALARVGLEDAPEIRPHDAPTSLRRRVALARALLLDPEILLLDDPLDDLDEAAAETVLDAVRRWAGEGRRAVLVSARDPRLSARLGAPVLPLPVVRA